MSVMVSQELKHIVQVSTLSLFPFCCVLLGYNISEVHIKNILLVFSIALLLFVFVERISLFLGLNIFGIRDLSLIIQDRDIPIFGRALGIYSNPNELGFVAGAMFFFFVYLGFNFKIALFISLPLIIFSASRGSLVAFLIGFMVIVFSCRKYFFKMLSFFVVMSTLVLFGMFSFAENVEDDVSRFYEIFDVLNSKNFIGRVDFWESVISRDDIAWGTIVPPQLVLGHAIDNAYFFMLSQGGFLALFTYSWLYVFLMFVSLREKLLIRKASAIGFLFFVGINSVTMLGFIGVSTGGIFWLFVGVLLSQGVGNNLFLPTLRSWKIKSISGHF